VLWLYIAVVLLLAGYLDRRAGAGDFVAIAGLAPAVAWSFYQYGMDDVVLRLGLAGAALAIALVARHVFDVVGDLDLAVVALLALAGAPAPGLEPEAGAVLATITVGLAVLLAVADYYTRTIHVPQLPKQYRRVEIRTASELRRRPHGLPVYAKSKGYIYDRILEAPDPAAEAERVLAELKPDEEVLVKPFVPFIMHLSTAYLIVYAVGTALGGLG